MIVSQGWQSWYTYIDASNSECLDYLELFPMDAGLIRVKWLIWLESRNCQTESKPMTEPNSNEQLIEFNQLWDRLSQASHSQTTHASECDWIR